MNKNNSLIEILRLIPLWSIRPTFYSQQLKNDFFLVQRSIQFCVMLSLREKVSFVENEHRRFLVSKSKFTKAVYTNRLGIGIEISQNEELNDFSLTKNLGKFKKNEKFEMLFTNSQVKNGKKSSHLSFRVFIIKCGFVKLYGHSFYKYMNKFNT